MRLKRPALQPEALGRHILIAVGVWLLVPAILANGFARVFLCSHTASPTAAQDSRS